MCGIATCQSVASYSTLWTIFHEWCVEAAIVKKIVYVSGHTNNLRKKENAVKYLKKASAGLAIIVSHNIILDILLKVWDAVIIQLELC